MEMEKQNEKLVIGRYLMTELEKNIQILTDKMQKRMKALQDNTPIEDSETKKINALQAKVYIIDELLDNLDLPKAYEVKQCQEQS